MARKLLVPVDYDIWKIESDLTLFVDRNIKKPPETEMYEALSLKKMGKPRSVISLLDCRTWTVSVHLSMSIWEMKRRAPGSSVFFFFGMNSYPIASENYFINHDIFWMYKLYKQPVYFMVEVSGLRCLPPGHLCCLARFFSTKKTQVFFLLNGQREFWCFSFLFVCVFLVFFWQPKC